MGRSLRWCCRCIWRRLGGFGRGRRVRGSRKHSPILYRRDTKHVRKSENDPLFTYKSHKKLLTFHLIPNAHLDPVWLWDWREGLNEGLITCRTILDLMDE